MAIEHYTDLSIVHQFKVIDKMKEKIDYAIQDLFHTLYDNFSIMYQGEGDEIGHAVLDQRESLLKMVEKELDKFKNQISELPPIREELITYVTKQLEKRELPDEKF